MPIPVDLPSPMNADGYASRRVTKAPNWHDLVALDMLFNNMTTGLFLVAATGELASPSAFGPVARAAYPVAMLFLSADLLCLVLDLGHKRRFHHMLRVFKPTSPMSMGTWCLAAYSLPLGLLAAIEASRAIGIGVPGWFRTVLVAAGIPFAMGSAMYKGVLFSTTSQPGWKDARWLGGYLTNSAIAIGCAELLAIAAIAGQGASALLRPSLSVLLAINAGFLARLVRELRPALRSLKGGGRLESAMVLGAVLGVGLPALLVLLSPILPPGAASFGDLAAIAMILPGNFLVRRAIVMLPHHENDERCIAR